MAPRSKILSVALAGMAVILGLAAWLLGHRPAAPVELSTGTYLAPRRSLPDFSLIDQRGQPYGSQNLRGHWSMLFFGYTNCPDFCPTTLVTLAAMEKRLIASGAAVRPQVVFVSVDAQRDTPERLAQYVANFDPAFMGLTASDQPTIEAVASKLGVMVVLYPKKADGSYTVDHSGAIFVLDPNGKEAAVLIGPFSPETLASDFQRIVAART